MSRIITLSLVGFLFTSMGAVFSAIGTNGAHFSANGDALVMLVFFIASLALLIFSIFAKSFSLVDMLLIYFVAISVGFSGYYEVATGLFPWPKVHTSGALRYALFVYVVFVLSYLAGHYAAGQRRLGKVYGIVDDRRFFICMCAMLCIAVICLASGGAAAFTARASEDAPDLDGLRPQLVQLGKCLSLTAFLFLLCVWLDKRKYGHLTLCAGFLLLICYNPITSPRFQFVAAAIATISVFSPFIRLQSATRAGLYCFLFLANYIIFGPLKSFSAGISGLDTSVFDNVGGFVSDYAFRVDFDAVQISANAITYFDLNGGFNFGYNILGAFLFFVPRGVWPSKPLAETIEIHDSLGYEYLNLSFPLPMEFYAVSGIVSVFICAFLLAYFLRRNSLYAYASYHFYGRRVDRTVLLALAAGYAPIILRGSLNGVAPLFGFSFIAYYIVVWLNRHQQAFVSDGWVTGTQRGR